MSKFASSRATLSDIRTVAICLLSFAAFTRFNEVASIQGEDLKFTATHAEITIKHSTTDQYRDGAVVLVSRSDIGTISEHVGCSVATQAISFPKHHETRQGE